MINLNYTSQITQEAKRERAYSVSFHHLSNLNSLSLFGKIALRTSKRNIYLFGLKGYLYSTCTSKEEGRNPLVSPYILSKRTKLPTRRLVSKFLPSLRLVEMRGVKNE